ncbi:hypothetical protein BDK51DRAFT_27512, partial [Blyttiomyces helicus]
MVNESLLAVMHNLKALSKKAEFFIPFLKLLGVAIVVIEIIDQVPHNKQSLRNLAIEIDLKCTNLDTLISNERKRLGVEDSVKVSSFKLPENLKSTISAFDDYVAPLVVKRTLSEVKTWLLKETRASMFRQFFHMRSFSIAITDFTSRVRELQITLIAALAVDGRKMAEEDRRAREQDRKAWLDNLEALKNDPQILRKLGAPQHEDAEAIPALIRAKNAKNKKLHFSAAVGVQSADNAHEEVLERALSSMHWELTERGLIGRGRFGAVTKGKLHQVVDVA